MQRVDIADIGGHVGQAVNVAGWLYNMRSKGKIAFLQLRDGTGRIQAVASESDCGAEIFAVIQEYDGLIRGKQIILATGHHPRALPGMEPDGKLIWSYREAMVAPALPKRLIVIGSGAIGSEFASFFLNMGAEVTLIEVMDRILPVEDAEISAFAKKSFVKQGMTILEKATVKKLDRAKGKVTAHIETGGKTETQEFDTVISAVGIVGNVENLGLEALGVKIDRTHVVTDEYCRTGIDGLYAIGDIAGAPWLAHKASHEGATSIRESSVVGEIEESAHLQPLGDLFCREHSQIVHDAFQTLLTDLV